MDRPLHFRRCHICDGVNAVETGRVETCSHCGRSLAPFYYFDDCDVEALSDFDKEFKEQGKYKPIRGLSAYWDYF